MNYSFNDEDLKPLDAEPTQSTAHSSGIYVNPKTGEMRETKTPEERAAAVKEGFFPEATVAARRKMVKDYGETLSTGDKAVMQGANLGRNLALGMFEPAIGGRTLEEEAALEANPEVTALTSTAGQLASPINWAVGGLVGSKLIGAGMKAGSKLLPAAPNVGKALGGVAGAVGTGGVIGGVSGASSGAVEGGVKGAAEGAYEGVVGGLASGIDPTYGLRHGNTLTEGVMGVAGPIMNLAGGVGAGVTGRSAAKLTKDYGEPATKDLLSKSIPEDLNAENINLAVKSQANADKDVATYETGVRQNLGEGLQSYDKQLQGEISELGQKKKGLLQRNDLINPTDNGDNIRSIRSAIVRDMNTELDITPEVVAKIESRLVDDFGTKILTPAEYNLKLDALSKDTGVDLNRFKRDEVNPSIPASSQYKIKFDILEELKRNEGSDADFIAEDVEQFFNVPRSEVEINKYLNNMQSNLRAKYLDKKPANVETKVGNMAAAVVSKIKENTDSYGLNTGKKISGLDKQMAERFNPQDIMRENLGEMAGPERKPDLDVTKLTSIKEPIVKAIVESLNKAEKDPTKLKQIQSEYDKLQNSWSKAEQAQKEMNPVFKDLKTALDNEKYRGVEGRILETNRPLIEFIASLDQQTQNAIIRRMEKAKPDIFKDLSKTQPGGSGNVNFVMRILKNVGILKDIIDAEYPNIYKEMQTIANKDKLNVAQRGSSRIAPAVGSEAVNMDKKESQKKLDEYLNEQMFKRKQLKSK